MKTMTTAPESVSRSVPAEEAVRLALDIGEQIEICGGEIGRVEDTVMRVCRAYGATRTDVLAITSAILVTAIWSDGSIVTQSRRILNSKKNMFRLEQMNALSRQICEAGTTLTEARLAFDGIISTRKTARWKILVGTILIAVSFTAFFGGSFRDCAASFFVGLVIYASRHLSAAIRSNKMLSNLITSFLAGSVAFLVTAVGIGESVDMIMAGCIMLLIPGLAMTNAVENIMTGDTISGLLGFFEALMVALALAGGFALSLYLLGGLL